MEEGRRLYSLTCATCHGANGKGIAATGAPPLLGRTKESLLGVMRNPPPLMPPIPPGQLSDADFDKVYQYILTLGAAS
ncbi:MAG: cytochrome c [Chloroflexota bacterium]